MVETVRRLAGDKGKGDTRYEVPGNGNGDVLAQGSIDPAQATSERGIILTTEALIGDIPQEASATPPMPEYWESPTRSPSPRMHSPPSVRSGG